MIVASPLDSASVWLSRSNTLYLVGSGLTVITALFVLYETRAVAVGRHVKLYLASEIAVSISAFLSLAGSIGAIHYGNVVSHLKDLELEAYKTSASQQIALAQRQGSDANKAAGFANQNAAQANLENTQLRLQLAKHETSEKKAEADLAAQNKQTSDFAHALAQQQATMAEQAHVSPVLTPFQIDALAKMLAPFAGQDVSIHTTSDTTVLRLERTIQIALDHAGVTHKQDSIDMGALFQGVSVAVHSPTDVPPIANALVTGLRSSGIDVHPVSTPDQVPGGKVAIFMGPN